MSVHNIYGWCDCWSHDRQHLDYLSNRWNSLNMFKSPLFEMPSIWMWFDYCPHSNMKVVWSNLGKNPISCPQSSIFKNVITTRPENSFLYDPVSKIYTLFVFGVEIPTNIFFIQLGVSRSYRNFILFAFLSCSEKLLVHKLICPKLRTNFLPKNYLVFLRTFLSNKVEVTFSVTKYGL